MKIEVDSTFISHDEVRSTPEGRLWMHVIAQAAADITETLEWIETGYHEQLKTLNERFHSGKIDREKLARFKKLAAQRRCILSSSSRSELASARKFFFGKDTGFCELVSLLGYDLTTFRSFLLPRSKQIREWENKLNSASTRTLLSAPPRLSSKSGRCVRAHSSRTPCEP